MYKTINKISNGRNESSSVCDAGCCLRVLKDDSIQKIYINLTKSYDILRQKHLGCKKKRGQVK